MFLVRERLTTIKVFSLLLSPLRHRVNSSQCCSLFTSVLNLAAKKLTVKKVDLSSDEDEKKDMKRSVIKATRKRVKLVTEIDSKLVKSSDPPSSLDKPNKSSETTSQQIENPFLRYWNPNLKFKFSWSTNFLLISYLTYLNSFNKMRVKEVFLLMALALTMAIIKLKLVSAFTGARITFCNLICLLNRLDLKLFDCVQKRE